MFFSWSVYTLTDNLLLISAAVAAPVQQSLKSFSVLKMFYRCRDEVACESANVHNIRSRLLVHFFHLVSSLVTPQQQQNAPEYLLTCYCVSEPMYVLISPPCWPVCCFPLTPSLLLWTCRRIMLEKISTVNVWKRFCIGRKGRTTDSWMMPLLLESLIWEACCSIKPSLLIKALSKTLGYFVGG